MKQEDVQITEAYLAGGLTALERETFETRLQNEPELYQEYLSLLAIRMGRKAAIKQEIAQVFDEETEGRQSPIIKPLWWMLAAAVVAVLVLAYFQLRPSAYERLFEQQFSAPASPYAQLGPGKDRFEQAFKLYDTEQYAAALEQFEQLSMDSLSMGQQDDMIFFRSIAYLAQANISAALTGFQGVINAGDSRYEAEARYFIAMAYLRAGDRARALAEFKSASQDEDLGDELQKKAQALVLELEMMKMSKK